MRQRVVICHGIGSAGTTKQRLEVMRRVLLGRGWPITRVIFFAFLLWYVEGRHVPSTMDGDGQAVSWGQGSARGLYREPTTHRNRWIMPSTTMYKPQAYRFKRGRVYKGAVPGGTKSSKSSKSAKSSSSYQQPKGKGHVFWKGAKFKGKGKGKGKGNIFDKDKSLRPTVSPSMSFDTPSPTIVQRPTGVPTSFVTSPPTRSPSSAPTSQPVTPEPGATAQPSTAIPTSVAPTLSPVQTTPTTTAPTPTEQGNGIFRIPNTGFNITFFSNRTEFVNQEQFDDLVGLSLGYLGDHMRNFFTSTDEYAFIGQSTRVRGTAFSFQSGTPLLHNYAGLFRDIRTVPTTEDIDSFIEPAFTEPDAVAEYIALIQTLPPDNPFSETYAIRYELVGGEDDAPDINIPGQQQGIPSLLITKEKESEDGNSNITMPSMLELSLFAMGVVYTVAAFFFLFRRFRSDPETEDSLFASHQVTRPGTKTTASSDSTI
jgi:hypothetical protein